ncbi:MAG: hypothetical protein WAN36_16185 [Calditrichia bacterium]
MTLYNRLTLTLSLLFVAATFLSVFISYQISYRFIHQQYEERIRTIAHNLALVSYPSLVNYNEVGLHQTAQSFLREQDVEYVMLLDIHNTVLVEEFGIGDSTLSFVIDPLSIINNENAHETKIVNGRHHQHMIIAPIRSAQNETVWGHAVVGFDGRHILSAAGRIKYYIIIINSVILVVALIFI